VAIGKISESIHNFVERAVAATGNHELAAIANGLLRNLGGVSGAGGFGEIGFDAIGGENATRLVKEPAAPVATDPRVWVVNQERIVKLSVHDLLCRSRDVHSI
jgi:hypothetical protein